MTKTVQIYVALLDEGVDAWRPVEALYIKDNVYKILNQPYDRTIENWQFQPGELVVCDMIKSSDGLILAATGNGLLES